MHAFGILSGLALVVAAVCAVRPATAAVLAAALAAALIALPRGAVLDPAGFGLAFAASAVLAWWRPSGRLALAAAGGAAGGVWQRVLEAQGVPGAAAAALVVALAAASFALASRRARFAPPALRDEALLLVVMFGLILAAVPGVAAGFRSAVALKAAPLGAEPEPLPWALAAAAACALGGGVYGLWRRR